MAEMEKKCGTCKYWDSDLDESKLGNCEYPNELMVQAFNEFKSKLPIALDLMAWSDNNSDMGYTHEGDGSDCNVWQEKIHEQSKETTNANN